MKTLQETASSERVEKKTGILKAKGTPPDQAYAMANSMEDRDELKGEGKQAVKETSTAGGAAPSIEGSPASVTREDEDYRLEEEESCEDEVDLSREDFVEELNLREIVKKAIGAYKTNKSMRSGEENNLRQMINKIISESSVSDQDPSPNRATGINVLEDLLTTIIPIIKIGYRQLTTSGEQRRSFRAHIINATDNTLKPSKINDRASERDEETEEVMQEEADVTVTVDDEAFIPVEDGDIEEPTEQEKFGIEGQNETGRNMAYNTFKKIETNILDAYDLLADKEDQELFYDYLITNLKLHFDKFESELSPSVEEPTTDEYEEAV
tara:strand:+ start:116 stop:1090 length:975 start_codon:yes stop_codon:yes gene_type:complete